MRNIITILLILIIPVAIYLIVSKNSNDISAIAKDNTNPTLISFTSTMCMDCQKMKAVISEVQNDYNGKVNFVSINALDKNRKVQEAIKKYHVVLVPTLVFLDGNGEESNKIEGFIPKEELIKELDKAVNG